MVARRVMDAARWVAVVSAAACGRPTPTPAPPFAQLDCSEGTPTCQAVEEGFIGCCVDAPAGRLRWPCREQLRFRTSDQLAPRPGLDGVRQLALGDYYGCGVFNDGQLRCWGRNSDGELGLGAYPTTSALLTRLWGATEEGVGSVEVGRDGSHVCARFADGTVRCAPRHEQLRGPHCELVANEDSETVGMRCDAEQQLVARCPVLEGPAVVPLPSEVVQVAAHSAQSCALDVAGTIWCWGRNDRGQVRRPASYAVPVPTPLAVPRPATALALSARGGCATTTDGSAWCWGARSPAPRDQGLTGVVDASGDADQGCARLSNGSVRCWGFQWPQLEPVPAGEVHHAALYLPELDAADVIATVDDAGCALQRQRVWCWGALAPGDDRVPARLRRAHPIPELDGSSALRVARGAVCGLRGDGWWCIGALPGDRPDAEAEARLVASGHGDLVLGSTQLCVVDDDGPPACRGSSVRLADDFTSSDKPRGSAPLRSAPPPTSTPPPALQCATRARLCFGGHCFDDAATCYDRAAVEEGWCEPRAELNVLEGDQLTCQCVALEAVCKRGVMVECGSRAEIEDLCRDRTEHTPRDDASPLRWCARGIPCHHPKPSERQASAPAQIAGAPRCADGGVARRACFRQEHECREWTAALQTTIAPCSEWRADASDGGRG